MPAELGREQKPVSATEPQKGGIVPKRRSPRDWSRLAHYMIAAVALYGAVLSTITWLDQRAGKARQLDVSLFFGAPIFEGEQLPHCLQVKAANPGYQPVMLTTAGVFLPDGVRYSADRATTRETGDWSFPDRLEPGENTSLVLRAQSLAMLCDTLERRGFRGRVSLVGFYEDALGTIYHSEPFGFDTRVAREIAEKGILPPPTDASSGNPESAEP